MIATTMTVWLALAAPAETPSPGLPPEAAARNERGIALVDAGRFDDGIDELERAYTAMPDPLKYRVERGMVAGSLRSALTRHYQATGAPAHLCRLRRLLHRHRSELLAALGASGSPDDVAGTDAAIREIDVTLAGRPCEEPSPPPEPPRPQPPPEPRPEPPKSAAPATPAPPPLHPPNDGPARQRRIHRAAGVLLGLGGLTTIGAVTAAAIYADRYRRLDALDRELDGPAEIAEWEQLHHGGRNARTAAVVTGSIAGILVVAGVAVLAQRPPRAQRANLAPAIGAHSWGLHLAGRF